ncbi:MAG: grasp-with-spasm system ATP-grasp peptide maturase [Sphingobacteriaceae bacterium]
MILIFSIESDSSTNAVIDWLNFYKEKWIRINEFEFGNQVNLNIQLKNNNSYNFSEIFLNQLGEIKSIWLRRYNYSSEIGISENTDLNLVIQMMESISSEKRSVWESFCRNLLPKNKWLNYFSNVKLSKLLQLEIAAKHDILVPETLITTSKKLVQDFLNENGSIISKPIESYPSYTIEDKVYTPFTKEIDTNFINKLPNDFFPMLFQRNIKKNFEVRCFYLNDKFYCMAMFTQKDPETTIDFRVNNTKQPTRRVPFTLPYDLERKLANLMRELELNSGSIDILYGTDSKFYFLEVNPVGQFGMVSYPCNYKLEKKIAEELIKLSYGK